LAPDDFVKQAGERAVRIEPEHLLELHRRRALVPLLRIVQRPPRAPTAVPVAASAVANFNDAELATAITNCVTLPPGVTRTDLVAALKAQREIRKTNPQRSPNVEAICRTWPPQHRYREVELAEELWPRLQEKVRRDVASGGRLRVPAARVGVRALQTALSSYRRQIAMRVR
jgi:hypothetical protein